MDEENIQPQQKPIKYFKGMKVVVILNNDQKISISNAKIDFDYRCVYSIERPKRDEEAFIMYKIRPNIIEYFKVVHVYPFENIKRIEIKNENRKNEK